MVDRPGHGLSDAMDYRGSTTASAVLFMNSLMTALGLEKAFLMGNSMGGYFALCFAEYPEKVSKLILIGAPAGMNKWIPPMLRLLGVSRLNRLLLKTVAKPSIKSARDIHKKLLVADVNKISLNLLEHTRQNQSLPGAMIAHTSLLENVLTLRGWKDELYLGNKLDRLEMQVHFIWGEQDAFESPETGKPKAASIKNYSFEIIKNAGHCPWLDQPGVCVASALRFLDNS
ncbi:MAG: alpha/beta hydrolase [Saprospiraceae bacterium]|nr:alpha/beta hydrolase [Saprospiraceae bacterium]